MPFYFLSVLVVRGVSTYAAILVLCYIFLANRKERIIDLVSFKSKL